MYYDTRPKANRDEYKRMLRIMGLISRLFSTSQTPYLYYRAHENIFARCFGISNNARSDDSADAYDPEEGIGIGLKTWVGQDNQKVAEFGKLRPQYENLRGMELVQKIAEYRNTRITTTLRMNGLNKLVYHIVRRVRGKMQIYEAAFDYIDREHITLDEKRGNANSIYFCDGRHTYHFSLSKNTLYMIFDDMELLDEFDVDIASDPYMLLSDLIATNEDNTEIADLQENQICLRLYAIDAATGEKYVPEKSGLNQWHAGGRARNPDELYIAYLRDDRERFPDFFPPRDTVFDLILPDGTEMTAKVCQRAYKKLTQEEYDKLSPTEQQEEDAKALVGKAIMSNPNKALGKWLLRDVLGVAEGTLVTYDMLAAYNIDSVIFTRLADRQYKIDFCPVGTYERYYGISE